MIPVFDLKRLHASIQKELDAAIHGVIDRGNFILGDEVAAFEKEFAAYIGVPHAVGVASGTDALTLALQVHDIGPGDEVIVPANAYPTAFGIAKSGVTIRLVDVNPDGNINPDLLPKVITQKTKAIIVVHLYGTPANMQEIRRATSHLPRITIIEDAAQAHGATIETRDKRQGTSNTKNTLVSSHVSRLLPQKAGSLGDIGCFSFYPSKNLGALGDGGAIVTKHAAVADKLKQLRMYGETSRYQSQFVAGVSRLDELQAAILRVKLRHLNAWVKKRRMIAKTYMQQLAGVGDITILSPESRISNLESRSAYHLFVIRTRKRDALMAHLTSRGIGTGIHYPTPIHTTKAFTHLGYKPGDFPVSEMLCGEVLSLPIYPHLTDAEIRRVTGQIKQFFSSQK